MRLRMMITAATCCALLAGCGDRNKAGSTIPMKDMEVVDGTATDAMTDLDGVQSEGTALSPTAGNDSNASEAAPKAKSGDPKAAVKADSGDDAEVLSDQ